MFEQTASAYKKIYNLVSAYKHYEFDVLKDLMEPSQKIIQDDSSSQIGQDNDKHLSSNNATGTNEEDVVDLLLDLNLTEEEVNQDEREEESPLGVSGKQDNHLNDSVETTDEKDQTTSVGPLPIAQLPSESVPKLDPPPGWKYSRKNHNEELCPNLVDLLSLEGAEVNSKSFAAEWQLACERTSQLEISNETSSFFGNFPSQLMDISNPTVNSFPNPFASQTMDDQSTAWEQFLSEYDTKEQRRIGEC
ncbi:hypothetical protein AB6A40_002167 [Gnathostoma spinigerum]|uniref:Uncharacterized protein n=1 Tax=Gnathostoma spinigerum TaxID=75299 RepID=A0ABD6E5X2_9BILA